MLAPEFPLAVEPSLLTRLLARTAGADTETLAKCPKRDHDTLGAVGWIMLFTAAYQTSLFTVVGHRLFSAPGRIDPVIVGVSAFVALFILQIDAFTIMRSGWHLNGIAELKRGGLDISGGLMARVKASCLLVIRILLALGIAQLTAIFVSILVFGHDIDARIDSDNLQVNAPLVATATARADADIQRQRDDVTAVKADIAAREGEAEALRKREAELLAAEPKLQAQEDEITGLVAAKAKADDELQAAQGYAINEAAGIKGAPSNSGQVGEGILFRAASEKAANAKARVAELTTAIEDARTRLEDAKKRFAERTDAARRQLDNQLASITQAISDDNTRIATLNIQLDQLVRGRDAAIHTAVTSAPSYVPRKDGLLIQIAALRSIADGSPEIGIVIILIEVTSFGFELAAVLAKVTSFVPTGYAAYLARDAYMLTVSIVDAMAEQLERRTPAAPPEAEEAEPTPDLEPANDNAEESDALPDAAAFDGPEDTPPTPPEPPKRPRGRPRKVPAE